MTVSTISTGYLFNRLTIAVLGIAAFWAAWSGLTGLVLLCGLVLASAGLTRSWALFCLKGVSFQRTLDKTRIFPNQTVQAKIEVSNRKILPVFWLQVDEQIPAAMCSKPSSLPSNCPGFSLFSSSLSLTGYSTARWQHRLTCEKRGVYPLRSVTLTSGDMFGFYSQTRTITGTDEVIVFPKIYDLDCDHFPIHSPLGESRADQNIYHDPSKMAGLRDYTPRDSLRHVHWKASARRRHLQVKVFESTVTIKTAIFICVDNFTENHGNAENYETAISTAASIAVKLLERKSHVGLYANTVQAGSGFPVNLPPKNSHAHLMELLETLARSGRSVTTPFNDLILEQMHTLPTGCTIVLILQSPNSKIKALLDELKADGHKIMVLSTGGQIPGDAVPTLSNHFQIKTDPSMERIALRKAQ